MFQCEKCKISMVLDYKYTSAFYNDNSKITLRLISRNANDTFDYDFFKKVMTPAEEEKFVAYVKQMGKMPENKEELKKILGF